MLASLRRPASTDELARLLDRHPNGVRLHLEQLRLAGLLHRIKESRGRGRPRDLWSIDPSAMPGGSHPTAYAELGGWLATSLEEGDSSPPEMEARGHQIGLELVNEDKSDGDAEARFENVLSAMGFQPNREDTTGNGATYCLGNCPYRDVVRQQQPLICALHRGITTGLLESIDPGLNLTDFEAKDPDEAGCLVRVDRPAISVGS